jgi:nicotinate dehydrogenase subunit A
MPTLRVNGQEHLVECEPSTPLLYALRNDLGLTGAHFGCGLGQCGACHVLIDGRSVASCDLAVGDCGDRHIETIEGLSPKDRPLHVLQQAFADAQAAQCGYCLGGVLSSARALLRTTPQPSEEQVKTALDRHLCRCGTHQRMVRAVLLAAQYMAQNPQ